MSESNAPNEPKKLLGDREQIEWLAQQGYLTARETERILSAIGRLESQRDSAVESGEFAPEVDLRGYGLKRAQYAMGKIEERELRVAMLLLLVCGFLWVASMFGLLMFCQAVFFRWLDDEPMIFAFHAEQAAYAGLIFATIFGIFQYFVSRRDLDNFVRNCETAGRPLPPFINAKKGQCPSCGAATVKPVKFETGFEKLFKLVLVKFNPVLAFFQSFLGIRNIESRTCKECSTIFTNCPQCEASVNLALWSGRGAFWNFGGCHCPRCSQLLPEDPFFSNCLTWIFDRSIVRLCRSVFRGRIAGQQASE